MDEDWVGPSSRLQLIVDRADSVDGNVLQGQIAVNGSFLFPGSAIAV
jgi:hypothetical protein